MPPSTPLPTSNRRPSLEFAVVEFRIIRDYHRLADRACAVVATAILAVAILHG